MKCIKAANTRISIDEHGTVSLIADGTVIKI